MYKKKIVILIDGHSYLYKIYYAKNKTIHKKNICINVIYSFLYILKSILMKYRPEKLIVVFDSKEKNFRNKIFKQYKIHRPNMPDLLKIILFKIKNILINIGIPMITIPKFEADDVIGTLSKIAEKESKFVLIFTTDKDLSQLINQNIYILNHKYNTIINIDVIKKKYGITPELIIDFLALIGDQSDNIPGVKGIGIKTAKILLQKIGNIRNIYDNFDKLSSLKIRRKKSIIEKLNHGKKMAFLSYQLAKIKVNIPLEKKHKLINTLFLFNPCTFNNMKYIKIIYDIKNIIINNKSNNQK